MWLAGGWPIYLLALVVFCPLATLATGQRRTAKVAALFILFSAVIGVWMTARDLWGLHPSGADIAQDLSVWLLTSMAVFLPATLFAAIPLRAAPRILRIAVGVLTGFLALPFGEVFALVLLRLR